MRTLIFLFTLISGSLGHSNDFKVDCVKMQCDENFKAVYKKALTGNSDAQNDIGEMFHFGKGVRRDFHLAKMWYLLSSNQGNPEAPNHLGRLYSNGEGVQKNPLEACGWYRVSRDRGHEWGKVNFKKCFAATQVPNKK